MTKAPTNALYEGRAGEESPPVEGLPPDHIIAVKLWSNPCWFSFRMNFLTQNFNRPIFAMIETELGLSRPEYIVIYSLSRKDNTTSTEIAQGSGFPKNTLSRAVKRLLELELVTKKEPASDMRSFVLSLTDKGRAIVERTMEPMLERERLMLSSLTPAERLMLSGLLTRMVLDAENWPTTITSTGP